jgi:hypothetical protein
MFADQPVPQQNLLAGASDNATTAAEDAASVRCPGQHAVPQIDGLELG